MSSKSLRYDEPKNLSRDTVNRLLDSVIDEQVERALLSLVFYDTDADRVFGKLFEFARSGRPSVRGTAVLCIGHAARIHGAIARDPTVEIINDALNDKDEYVRGHANSAADDIELFVPEVGKHLRTRK